MLVKRRPSPETIEVLGTKVMMITQDYSKPETFIMYGDPVMEFETDANFMEVAAAGPKSMRIDAHRFDETMHVFIDFSMHRLMQFSLPPMMLDELVFNISRIYMEVFNNFHLHAEICCDGHEHLYLKKVKVHPDNVVSLIIAQRFPKRRREGLLSRIAGRLRAIAGRKKEAPSAKDVMMKQKTRR